MATHMIAFDVGTVDTAFAPMPIVPDSILTPSGADRFVVAPGFDFVHWGFGCGGHLARAKLVSPSLEVRREQPALLPLGAQNTGLSFSRPPIWLPYRPIQLSVSETIEVQDQGDATHTGEATVVLALGPQQLPNVPDGDMRVVRAVGTTTLTAGRWTEVPLTLDQSLEPGIYHLCGMLVASAGVIAARALITGQTNRPGVVGFQGGAEETWSEYAPERIEQTLFYDMGAFSHINVPSLEFLSISADTAEIAYLYVVRTGSLAG